MRKFDATMRLSLSKYGGSDYALKEIERIETMAKAARERGENPPVILAHKVKELQDKVHLSNIHMANEYRRLIDESRVEYERQRDKKPELDLARMRRAEMMVDSMSAKEQQEVGHKYATDQIDLDQYEANILVSRLRNTDKYEDVKETMKFKRANQPWMQDPDVSHMADEASRYEALHPGELVVNTKEGRMAANIQTLIDFEGELDRIE